MNIKEAKEIIKDTVKIYLKKDAFGDYKIPVMRQRPIFLLGAPGIGKTAIMEQIASELDIALVSYSMTHHTRQSALGLPFIEKKEYAGTQFSVSEYTMSEILASVYDTMEQSGVKEGILFLDEINCVSETLYPSMLQFLQYKVFGMHKLPEGWIVVTAGNPPEFNRAVREFDVVTLDRLKVLEIDADYDAWKMYAETKGVHGSILQFLDINKNSFYKVETGVDGRHYVTARGWEDLSDIIYLYEEDKLPVTNHLISQYIKIDSISREFGAFYDLYVKYQDTYHVDEILEGNYSDDLIHRAQKAPLDERLSLTTLLFQKALEDSEKLMQESDLLMNSLPSLRKVKEAESVEEGLHVLTDAIHSVMNKKEQAGSLTKEEKTELKRKLAFYEFLKQAKDKDALSSLYNEKVTSLKQTVEHEKERMTHMLSFEQSCFAEDSDEMLVLITKLTMHPVTSRFFATFPVDSFLNLCNLLAIDQRSENLRKNISELFI